VASAPVEWNAGELGCGELVMELRNRLAAMKPGELFRLVALDPGAPADIPAWCRMTGHTLVSTQHPVYLIQRKED
jgi:tRNA 2-thiouridine synthesizing protein A